VNRTDYAVFRKEYGMGKYPHQRYGQAFCNRFNLTKPELFYSESRMKSEAIIERILQMDTLEPQEGVGVTI